MTDAPKIVPTEVKEPVAAEEIKTPEVAGPIVAPAKPAEPSADAKN